MVGNTHQKPIAFPVSRSPPEPCHLDMQQNIYMAVTTWAGAFHEMLPVVVILDPKNSDSKALLQIAPDPTPSFTKMVHPEVYTTAVPHAGKAEAGEWQTE